MTLHWWSAKTKETRIGFRRTGSLTCWSAIYRQYSVSYSQSEGETQGIDFHIHCEKYTSYSGQLETTKQPVGDYFGWTIRNSLVINQWLLALTWKNAWTVHTVGYLFFSAGANITQFYTNFWRFSRFTLTLDVFQYALFWAKSALVLCLSERLLQFQKS